MGHLEEARDSCRRALALGETRPVHFALNDPRTGAYAILGSASAELGFLDQALEAANKGMEQADLGEPATAAYSRFIASSIHIFRGEYAEAEARAAEGIRLSAGASMLLLGLNRVFHGAALAGMGNHAEGLAEVQTAVEQLAQSGASKPANYLLALTALRAGEIETGLRAVDQYLEAQAETGAALYAADVLRVKGELLLRRNPPDRKEAERSFRDAIEAARANHARFWELRATISLARLMRKDGRAEQARAMLAEIYNWFTEGFDTADLKDAKALLDELST